MSTRENDASTTPPNDSLEKVVRLIVDTFSCNLSATFSSSLVIESTLSHSQSALIKAGFSPDAARDVEPWHTPLSGMEHIHVGAHYIAARYLLTRNIVHISNAPSCDPARVFAYGAVMDLWRNLVIPEDEWENFGRFVPVEAVLGAAITATVQIVPEEYSSIPANSYEDFVKIAFENKLGIGPLNEYSLTPEEQDVIQRIQQGMDISIAGGTSFQPGSTIAFENWVRSTEDSNTWEVVRISRVLSFPEIFKDSRTSRVPIYQESPFSLCDRFIKTCISATLPPLPVRTPFKLLVFQSMMDKCGIADQFSDVLQGLEYGFSLGLSDFKPSESFCPPNHYSSEEDHQFVVDEYREDMELGRMSRGYTQAELEQLFGGPIRSAPLGVIQQPNKRRIIMNHSHPRRHPKHTSVNEFIDMKQFRCSWGTWSQCFLLVANLSTSAQACVFDVRSAFRNVPVAPAERRWTLIRIGAELHIDHNLNFGISPAPAIWGRIADVFAHLILLLHGIPSIHWVDDFVFFRTPIVSYAAVPSWPYDATPIWSLAGELGWPWAPEKFMDWSSVFLYVGFQWDIANKTVSLPQAKIDSYISKLDVWLAPGFRASCLEVQFLIGTLNHVILVIKDGRSRLPSLHRFKASFNDHSRHAVLAPSTEVTSDLEWWRHRLSSTFCGIDIVHPPEPLDVVLHVDASTSWGIALMLEAKWLAWELKEGWEEDGRGIGWAEMVAVDLAIRTLISSGYANCHIVLRSDNQGVVGALKRGASRNPEQNRVLQEIVGNITGQGLWITTSWVPTEENLADGPSRGKFPSRTQLYDCAPILPDYLSDYVQDIVRDHDPRLAG